MDNIKFPAPSLGQDFSRSFSAEDARTAVIDRFLLYAKTRSYSRGKTIINAGAVSDSIYYLVKGTVSVILENQDGKRVVLNYLEPGAFFGEMGFLSKEDNQRSASCIAKTACQIAEIPYSQFREFALRNPLIMFILNGQITDRLRSTTVKVGNLSFYDVAGRIANTLMSLKSSSGATRVENGMELIITRQELGDLVNCSREEAGRVLKVLEDQGLIEIKGRSIVVLNQLT